MRSPLYNWEIEVKQKNDELKLEFLELYSEKLDLNNRFITLSEKIDIKEGYDLKDELLDEIIDNSNELFIKKNESKFLNEFYNQLNSNKELIDDEKRIEFHYKYSYNYHDYYESLKMDELIDKHNKRIILNEEYLFKQELHSLKKIITSEEKHILKSKYINFDNYRSIDEIIDRYNRMYIAKYQDDVLSEFYDDLNKFTVPLNNGDIEEFKNKFNRNGENYFEKLGLDYLIKQFNKKKYKEQYKEVFVCLRQRYGSHSSPIPTSVNDYLISKFPNYDWDELIRNYNKQYFNNASKSNITEHGVYYLKEYIRKNDWGTSDSYKVEISKQILDYKDHVPDAITNFTNDIIKFVEFFANYGLDKNDKKIYLVSIPSSTKTRDNNSSIKQTIKIIENKYKKGLLNFHKGCEREIIDLSALLIRKEDINPAHLSKKRPTYNDHRRTIGFNQKIIGDYENNVFLILDDITTSGIIMNVCTDILVKNGINKNKICKLAIARTV